MVTLSLQIIEDHLNISFSGNNCLGTYVKGNGKLYKLALPEISDEIEYFLGEWFPIKPTKLSKIALFIKSNKIILKEWEFGSNDHPEDYYWGETELDIDDFIDNEVSVQWKWSTRGCIQQISLRENGVMCVSSEKYYFDNRESWTFEDYFYKPNDNEVYAPTLINFGLYQKDPIFIDLVYKLNCPDKIVQYMEENFEWELHNGSYSPYQFFLKKYGDCGDFACFSCHLANFHGYDCQHIYLKWQANGGHSICVYSFDNFYTYSSNDRYFTGPFESVEACVNHCRLRFSNDLYYYKIYDCDYYGYRNITIR